MGSHPFAHGLVDTGLPAFAAGFERGQHVCIKPDGGGHFQWFVFGAALAHGAQLCIGFSREELTSRQGAGKVGIGPFRVVGVSRNAGVDLCVFFGSWQADETDFAFTQAKHQHK